MVNIGIKYNPYKVKTEFFINNETMNFERINKNRNKRLQYWLESNENWDGIIDELARVLNENEFKITFTGRKIDFDDLNIIVKKQSKFKVHLEYVNAKNDNDIVSEIDNIFNEFKEGPIEELKSKEIIDTYEEVKSSNFKVHVIATMSSGKSTLINSLIGYELLPAKNEACTATIARIRDNDDVKEFTAECRDENEVVIYEKKSVDLQDITNYNQDEKVTYIDMEGPIPNISSEKLNLLLMDTPGPNNSRNKDHGELTSSIINDRDKSVVLYVINATQFGINDDSELLSMISDAMKRGGKQSKDRFIFVINKCDQFDCEKEESIQKLLVDVKAYLEKYGIEDPNLYPVSSQMAKLIRMHDNNIELTRQEKRFLSAYEDFIDFKGYHFDELCSLSESSRVNLNSKLDISKRDENEYEEALIHTGIPAVEEAINEYLEKYAYPIKINNAVDSFNQIIEEKEMMGNLDSKLISDNKEFEKVRHQIQDTINKLESGKKAKSIKDKIDKFEINSKALDKIIIEIERNLNRLTRGYTNKNAIDESIVEQEIERFKREISSIEKSFVANLSREINNTVIKEGEKLVSEYQDYLSELKEEINIDGFEFDKIGDIKKLRILDAEDLIDRYSKKEIIYETYVIKNSERKWYNPFTYNLPKYISIKGVAGEKTLVDINNVVQEQMGAIKNEVYKNTDLAKLEASEQVKNLKIYFKKELDKLDKLVENILVSLEESTANRDEIEKRVKSNEKAKLWLDYIVNRINKIMDI